MAKSIMAEAIVDEHKALEDHDLLVAIAAKDKRAFELLYRRYSHRLVQFVSKMIRDSQTAEEVVDDTLFAIWKSADRFKFQSRVSTWIFGIAYRQSLKALERERKHGLVDNDEDKVNAVAAPLESTNPEAQTAISGLKKLVEHGLEKLSDEHRTAVQLTAMGYSYQEIAGIVGCPANTIKTRVFYARQKLKKILGQHDSSYSE